MSKAIKWQIPFVSLSGTQYRLDIYAEDDGTWDTESPIQLTAGETPFVTEENNNEDMFTPVRGQSGTIQICTILQDGSQLDINDILPANNIDHPVRLINLSNSNAIEWQGFLSCEAYSQAYTAIPDIFSFTVLSVLDAMESVQVDSSRSFGFTSVSTAIYHALNEINIQSGMSLFTYVNYSITSWQIFQKMIDQTLFFERREYNNEESTTYIVSGISTKEVLEKLCIFMGWIARERGTEIYFEYIGEPIGMYRRSFIDFERFESLPTTCPINTQNINNLEWRGIDHKRTILQGAKSVEVVSNLDKYELSISVPPCPIGSLSYITGRLWTWEGTGDNEFVWANNNLTAYSNIHVAYYSALLRYMFFHFASYQTSTLANVLSHMAIGANSTVYQEIRHGTLSSMERWYAGAFLCKFAWEPYSSQNPQDIADALYCVFFPHSLNYSAGSQMETTDFDPSQVGPIFSIDSVLSYRCGSGYLRLSASANTIFQWPYNGSDPDWNGAELVHDEKNYEWFIGIELRIGNNWWNGSAWQGTQTIFKARFFKNDFKKNWTSQMPIPETDGLLIPVTDELVGLVTLKIWPMISPTNFSESNSSPLEMIFTKLEVTHIKEEEDVTTTTDRSANHYFRLLGTNFKNEVSISSDIASFMNNQPSPSLIMTDAATPASTVEYIVGEETEERRPEIDLLNRMDRYYSAARQRLQLITKHPTWAALPLLKLNGINDGKTYLPLSESRDWREETSTITCFETLETPSES